ncbi:hypothetical protein [Nonomuraea sp. 10N515B]|uniref:hypothetical protein n=1 Tax=Nonomuraea sp. 10N515B TaxID=3457422 RepID=UPI003FCD9F11
MAGRSTAPISIRSSDPGVGIRLTITWEINDGLSVEQAARLCELDAAKVLPVVRGKRPVLVTAEPCAIRPEVTR